MEIRHFGVGNRRPDGPPGTTNLEGQVIHSDGRGVIAELAFKRRGRIPLHENPNTTWFCVIEGGGFVQVGDEQRRVGPGDAVLWPPGVLHGAWTVGTQMRAIVVEFAGPDDARIRGILEGTALRLGPGERGRASRGVGKVSRIAPSTGERRRSRSDVEREGEPD
ncbi:MAG TPA: cupin domain-containing protein [Candidatus Limnocylindrales bacterium]